MINKLIGVATLFAAGSLLMGAPPTLGSKDLTAAPGGSSQLLDDGGLRCGQRCGRRCGLGGGGRCGRRCGRRCGGRCGRR